MAAIDPSTPIIIKRIKKGGHAHHGGAWKVAYADFVTAMMAFFLLLWLINTTTPEQKEGIAEYFTPTIGIKDSKGIGFEGGRKPSEQGTSKSDLTPPGEVLGQLQQGPTLQKPTSEAVKEMQVDASANKSQEDKQDSEMFQVTEQEIRQSLEQDPDLKAQQNDVILRESNEGLKIDMIDDEKKPMFMPGTATLTDNGKKVLDNMAAIISKTPNNLSISGHTDASGATVNPDYTNWELSADRANAARRALATTQLDADRVIKVVGLADHDLLTPQEPTSPRNRRVTIILLRGNYARNPTILPTTKGLLSVPETKLKPGSSEPKKDAPKADDKDKGASSEGIFDPNKAPAVAAGGAAPAAGSASPGFSPPPSNH